MLFTIAQTQPAFGNLTIVSCAIIQLQALLSDLPESGSMSCDFQRLAGDAVGVYAQMRAKYRGLLCEKYVPMFVQCLSPADSVI